MNISTKSEFKLPSIPSSNETDKPISLFLRLRSWFSHN